jgi:HK97 family phage major capsid protein
MSKSVELKGLREKRAAITAELRKLGEVIRAEGRPMSGEEREKFGKLEADFTAAGDQIRATEADIAAIEKQLSLADQINDHVKGTARSEPGREDRDHRPADKGRGDAASEQAVALQGWLRAGQGKELSDEQMAAMKRLGVRAGAVEIDLRFAPPGEQTKAQKRALSVGTTTAGGYTVPEGFGPTLDRALLAYADVRRVAQVIRTDTGNAMPWPTVTDTSNTGELLAENTTFGASVDPTFGIVNFSAYKYSSKPVMISHELLNDSAFNLEQVVAEMLGERIGRIQGTHMTTGTGTSQPQGVVTGATAGITAASATAIAGTEIVRLAHKLDPAYRRVAADSVGYMCHDGILAALAILVDSNGQPLFQTSFREGAPDRLYGYPVFNNQAMQATIATATVTVVFGDYKGYAVRDVNMVRFVRLNERYADLDQVAFVAFMRTDARYLNAAKVYKLTQA